jgi:hypothetical protein
LTAGDASLFTFTDDRKTATKLIDSDRRLCISPNFSGIFGVSADDFNNFKTRIGDLTKNPVISMRFNTLKDITKPDLSNLQIEFKTNEYVFTADASAGPKFGIVAVDTSSSDKFIESTGGCRSYDDKGVTKYPIVVGRNFVQRNYVLFKAQLKDDKGMPVQNGKRYIGFSQYLPLDKITNGERLILLGFGILMVVLIMVALIFRLNSKSDNEGGDANEKDNYAKV